MMTTNKIAIIDLWTDSNRGDCALQLGLIKMIREKHPMAKISGIFRFGYNEKEQALSETQYTRSHLDRVFFAPRPTLYAGENAKSPIAYKKIHSAYSFVISALYILLFFINLRVLIPQDTRETLDILSSSDLVYWKGKNFRDYSGLSGVQRQFTLLFAGYVARILCKKVCLVNASFWNIENGLQKFMIKLAINHCADITVRDLSSKANLEALGVASRCCKDLSFFEVNSHLPLGNTKKEYSAVITVTSWGSPAIRKNYVHYLARIINYKLSESTLPIAISPQVVRAVEDNSRETSKLLDLIVNRDRIHQITDAETIQDLMELYSKSEILIGTRMHSCVFAASVGTPFLAIAYDSGPKWEVLYDFADTACIKSIDKIDPDLALLDITQCKLSKFDMKLLSSLAQSNV